MVILQIATQIKNIIVLLFGRHIFKEIYTGGIFPKYGNICFMVQPWNTIYDVTNQKTKLTLNLDQIYLGSRFGALTPYKGANFDKRSKYLLGRLTLSYQIKLSMIDGTIQLLEIQELPKEFLAPQYKSSDEIKYKKKYYSKILDYLNNRFKDHVKPELVSVNLGKVLIHDAILKLLNDKYKDNSEMSYIERKIRTKIFTDDQVSPTGGRIFRKDLLNWLTARGTYTVKLYYYGKNNYITLTPDDFNQYFKEDYVKMIQSLKKISIGDRMELSRRNLIEMKDFIIDILQFIKELSEISGDKKIILYPFKPLKDGYNLQKSDVYVPDADELEEQQGELEDWMLRRDYKDIGFVFDPGKPKNFKELFPQFLGLVLVDSCAFVVRIPDENMDSDECLFVFDVTRGLLPSQIKGLKGGDNIPPTDGMKWWNQIIYTYLFYRWNYIANKHNLLGIHKFRDPEVFYRMCDNPFDSRVAFIREFQFED